MRIVEALLAEPWAAVLIIQLSGIFCCFTLSGLSGSLLKMHRSKTGVKKLLKNYNFWQRFLLQPAKEQCLHAKRFCEFVIVLYRIRLVLWIAVLGMAVLFLVVFESGIAVIYTAIGLFLLIDLPAEIVHELLSKPHFFRPWQGFRFEQYHNTSNHDSLL